MGEDACSAPPCEIQRAASTTGTADARFSSLPARFCSLDYRTDRTKGLYWKTMERVQARKESCLQACGSHGTPAPPCSGPASPAERQFENIMERNLCHGNSALERCGPG